MLGDFMLKDARNRIEPIVLRYCITIGSGSVSYLRATAEAIAHAADNKAASRFGVLRCFRTFDRLAEPKSTPFLVASPSADLVLTEPKADRTWLRFAVQYVAVSVSPRTARMLTAESNWLFAEPVECLTTGVVVVVVVRESETVLISKPTKATTVPTA